MVTRVLVKNLWNICKKILLVYPESGEDKTIKAIAKLFAVNALTQSQHT